jgi:hypothetical protein
MTAPKQDPDRWLVTINGRVVLDRDMNALNQWSLSDALRLGGALHGICDWRSEFGEDAAAVAFRDMATREFPEDDVRLWASVNTTTTER